MLAGRPSEHIPAARLNDALRQAGYEGELLPEREIQEFIDRNLQIAGEIASAFESDPALKAEIS